MRLAVVGLGAAGLSAALAAADAGIEVVGFEQSGLDNQEASSGGRGKIVRFGYDDPFYADLMRSTLARWDRLAARTGARLMDRNGGLHIGSAADIDIVERGILDAGHGFDRVGGRVTGFGMAVRDGQSAIVEPAAGVMWTSAVRTALASAATDSGATLHEHTQVEAIERHPGGVAVRTRSGSDVFDRVIVAGGPWAFRIAPAAASGFTIIRHFQLVFATDGPIGDGLARPWIDMDETTVYGMINVAPGVHLVGLHDADQGQCVQDPDEPDDQRVRASAIERERAYVRERFGVEAREIDIRVCHYTSTSSHDFVIDDCPGHPGVTLLSPCSGHGFKFSITMGAYAVALATGQAIPDRERFRLELATMG